jgi:2-oxoglutarate ferredoxin oxidoreductase subunit gamma
MKLTEIRVAGFGGQGVMLAANIIGKAACIHAGGYATMTQNYGPEARGGASSSQLVISDEPVLYPYTTAPDILIALSQEAFTRFAPEMNKRGMLLVEQDLVRLTRLPDGIRVFSLPATRLAEELGKKMVLNVIMVGFFAAKSDLLPKEAYQKAIADSVPANSRELNLRAFEKGYDYGLSCPETAAECLEADESNPVLAE